ncbi:MAG: D-tyrosyl-tRNA(Tyr) deacylase [Lachnospiraceae bacterium]|nr:D-tyrosyl-tRNA(Tyr) deacylase [Lachnospiraceae bacterium]
MRFVIQRVTEANVSVDQQIVGAIDRGLLVLVGVSQTDTRIVADKMIKKLLGLRIFEDQEGKTNLSLQDVDGSLLLISQFTLYADCRKGNRPSFINAGAPELAEDLYQYIINQCRDQFPNLPQRVQQGRFGANMKVSLLNDGPFTVILDSETLSI